MPDALKPPLPTANRQRARKLRGDSTDAERKLWRHLRGGRLLGLKFRRQHPVPPYILDFYCESLKLAVELDGSQHSEAVDRRRTAYLRSQGIAVLRFWDNQVLEDLDGVLESIRQYGDTRTLTPTPLPTGEGLEPKSDER